MGFEASCGKAVAMWGSLSLYPPTHQSHHSEVCVCACVCGGVEVQLSEQQEEKGMMVVVGCYS